MTREYTLEELETIEEDIESFLMDHFVFEKMTDELEFRIVMWITAVLKEEHNIERPIKLIWEKCQDYPVLMILDGPDMPVGP